MGRVVMVGKPGAYWRLEVLDVEREKAGGHVVIQVRYGESKTDMHVAGSLSMPMKVAAAFVSHARKAGKVSDPLGSFAAL